MKKNFELTRDVVNDSFVKDLQLLHLNFPGYLRHSKYTKFYQTQTFLIHTVINRISYLFVQ